METILLDFREDLAEYIRSDSYLTNVTVLTQKQASTLAEINRKKALVTSRNGKIGAAIIVMDPIADDLYPNVPYAVNQIIQVLRVLEHPEINAGPNGTGLAALAIARRLQRICKHYQAVGFSTPLIIGKPSIVPVDIEFVPLAYDVNFFCQEADTTKDSKVATPDISPESGAAPQTVTLTCATADAQIYYTLDGTHPWSGNPTAVLYSAPIAIAAAATLRAAAFKSGMIASNINRAQYT